MRLNSSWGPHFRCEEGCSDRKVLLRDFEERRSGCVGLLLVCRQM